ncbi:DUF1707 SHOCT-like domain-containing protein [Actinosynnema sp. CS-041913]|uniref:DUF1707 SHOCT-like domain-containing protein n=1 Tax=Actinosynnema sp. CS-041913 TaxID=3239917 RepID=UPI003D938BC6
MTHPVRPEDMRASDAEREVVQQWLHRAHADGSLDLAEFDQRVVRTWQAKTRGELAALTADLPQTALTQTGVVREPPPKPVVAKRGSGGKTALRVLTTIWMSVSAFNFAIWLLVSLLGGQGLVHPWFLWVAVPAGSVLGVVWLVTVRPAR